jgi:hypothetical protein
MRLPVWSVWPEHVDLYLSQTVAMVSVGSRKPMIARYSATLPVERVLSDISASVEMPRSLIRPRRRLHVILSGALCPAINAGAPANLLDLDELRSLSVAAATVSSGCDAEAVVVEIDAMGCGISAVMTTQLLNCLGQWANANRLKLISVQPLWAATTNCRATRDESVQGILLHEPDSVTLLVNGVTDTPIATTIIGPQELETEPVVLRRLLVGAGLQESSILRLGFGEPTHEKWQQGPKAWMHCWIRS